MTKRLENSTGQQLCVNQCHTYPANYLAIASYVG